MTSEKEFMKQHQAIKCYKPISKEFGLHKSTVRQICVLIEEIQDHCYLTEKWSTNIDHSKAERVIVCKVAKVPRITSKQLKAFLALANVNVHEPTIRRALSNHGVHGRDARSKPLFSKKKSAYYRSAVINSSPRASPALHISYVTLIASDVCSNRTQVPCEVDITGYSAMIPVRSVRIYSIQSAYKCARRVNKERHAKYAERGGGEDWN